MSTKKRIAAEGVMMHPDLSRVFDASTELAIHLSIYILAGAIGVGLFFNGAHLYPLWLGKIDASFTLIALLYTAFINPLILSGKIKVFYKRDYTQVAYWLALFNVFYVGAVVRFVVVSIGFVVLWIISPSSSSKWGATYINKTDYWDLFVQYFDVKFIIGAIIYGALTLIVLFFSERYIEATDFTKKYNKFKKRELNLDVIMESITMERDFELGYYRGSKIKEATREKGEASNTLTKNKNSNTDSASDNAKKETDLTDSEMIVRRKPRF